MLGIDHIMEMMHSNNGLTKSLTIPRIQLELDEVHDGRKCSILYPESKRRSSSILYPESKRGSILELEKPRKKRKSSFSTFQIIDENNCGMFMKVNESADITIRLYSFQ